MSGIKESMLSPGFLELRFSQEEASVTEDLGRHKTTMGPSEGRGRRHQMDSRLVSRVFCMNLQLSKAVHGFGGVWRGAGGPAVSGHSVIWASPSILREGVVSQR